MYFVSILFPWKSFEKIVRNGQVRTLSVHEWTKTLSCESTHIRLKPCVPTLEKPTTVEAISLSLSGLITHSYTISFAFVCRVPFCPSRLSKQTLKKAIFWPKNLTILHIFVYISSNYPLFFIISHLFERWSSYLCSLPHILCSVLYQVDIGCMDESLVLSQVYNKK